MRRIKKKHVDDKLLQTIFKLEKEWKYAEDLGSKSVERSLESKAAEKLAQAKYLYLLLEARRRNINALQI